MLRSTVLVLVSAAALFGQTTSGWKLVWSDEFNAPAGTPPDPSKWNYDLGGGGWGNGELEVYTNSQQNVFQDGKGNLVIRAIRDANGNYTSTRLQTGSPTASTHTTDLSWQYGRISARIKIPYAKGVWPAFWMLGENIGTAGWPTCGEIDIMENFGALRNNLTTNAGTAHGPGYSAGAGITNKYTLPMGQTVSDDFHIYAIEWGPDSVEWSVDGVSYHKVTPASLPAGKQWVFNAPFFLLLNMAVGGTTSPSGTPDKTAPFAPQDMLVDYVRVYQAAPVADAAPVITPGRMVNAASYLGTISPGSLTAIYGANLADRERVVSGVDRFPFSLGDTTVSVNGVAAALLYASPTQIDFQTPWETAPSLAIDVKVMRGGVESNVETVSVGAAAPSMFLNDFTSGVAWVTGDGCALTECAVQAGSTYQLWANGFGPKNGAATDGAPPVYAGSLDPLQVPGGCQLTVDGKVASVLYCGAAPGLIIDQLNFVYPAGVSTTAAYVEAALTIGGVTGNFRLPSPR